MKYSQFILFTILLNSFNLFGQLPVSTSAQNKNVLLEEYTGLHCSFCPDGAKMADELHDKNKDDLFIISWHTGTFAAPAPTEPDYRTNFGTGIEVESGVVGFPGGSINRHIFSGTKTSLSRYSWETYADQTISEPSYVNIAMNADINLTTRVVTIDAELYFTGTTAPSTIYFNIALLQDNIIGPQNGREKNPHYMMPSNEYRHMHMLRHLITGQWGDTLTGTTQSTLIAKQYQYTIPPDINGVPVDLTNLSFYGFVNEGTSETITVNNAHITFSGVPNGIGLVDISAKTKMITPPFCDPNATPEVTIYNNSTTPIDTFEVSYSLNSGTPVVQFITTPLLAGDSTLITFSPIVVSAEKNAFIFNVNIDTVVNLIDSFQNNQYSYSNDFFYILPTPFGTSFSEDFESYNHGVIDPTNAFLITPPVGSQAYVVDNNNMSGVNNSLGGFWKSQQSFRWKLPFIPSGIESSLIYQKMNFSAATDSELEFSYAYSQNTSNSQDSLNIDISTDCGTTWTTVFGDFGSSLATAPAHSGFFYPDSLEWKKELVNLSAYDGESEVLLRFRVYSDDGASLFLDDINVSTSVGIHTPQKENNFSVFPNPSNGQVTISGIINSSTNAIINVSDLTGKIVQHKIIFMEKGKNTIALNLSTLAKGMYYISINTDESQLVTPISIIE